jgi:hypothetical protein
MNGNVPRKEAKDEPADPAVVLPSANMLDDGG